MNPILPLYYAAPDGEAHVWKANPNTMYLYASNDRIGGGGMDPWQNVWSTRDLISWKDHGVGFNAHDASSWKADRELPAIDVIEKDGKYFYYYTSRVDGVTLQCAAVSDKPEGPFTDGKPIYGTEFPSCGDPSVFVDDDGGAYLFWGQFSLRGAKLKDNMHELEPGTLREALLTENEHGFHEGSSIRKRGDKYYMIFADTDRGAATCLSYAVSDSPLGEYKKGGVIIDNRNCDIASWNNHGSIVCFKDEWYVMYHRAALGYEMGGRKACMERIQFDDDGNIAEVVMTTQGVEPPLPAASKIDAYRACEFNWAMSFVPVSSNIMSRAFFWKEPATGWRETMKTNFFRSAKDFGVRAEHVIIKDVHSEYLTKFRNGDAAIYRYIDFGGGVSGFRCRAASYLAVTLLELRLDKPDGQLIGVCEINHTGGWGNGNWEEFSCPVNGAEGVHALYIVAKDGGNGSRLCDLDWFEFN